MCDVLQEQAQLNTLVIPFEVVQRYCRKYVKSQKARGVQAYQYTQDTITQRSTMRKQGSDDKEKPRGGRPLVVFFSHPCLFIG